MSLSSASRLRFSQVGSVWTSASSSSCSNPPPPSSRRQQHRCYTSARGPDAGPSTIFKSTVILQPSRGSQDYPRRRALTAATSSSQSLSSASSSSSHHKQRSNNSDSSSSKDKDGGSKQKKKQRYSFDLTVPLKQPWSNYVYPMSLGVGIGFGMALFPLCRDRLYLEEAQDDKQKKQSKPRPKTTKYGLDDVTIICLVGVPGAGKSTQAKKLSSKFKDFQVLSDISSVDQLKETVESKVKQSKGKETLLIVDGFPGSLQQAQEFEKETSPIFVVLYFDLPEKQWKERNGQDTSTFSSAAQSLEPLVKHFRHRGNILEISADWPDAEEVWEQVEAKVEQVLELKAMGEDVSVTED